MKTCSKCNLSKVLSEFNKDKTSKDGHSYWCRLCANSNGSAWRNTKEGKTKKSLSSKKWQQSDKGKTSHNASNRKYSKTKKGRASNRRSCKKYQKTPNGRISSSRTAKKIRATDWGRAYHNEHSMKRHASKMNRTPKWLTKEQRTEIRSFYLRATKLSKETGILYHVDHIVPLQGKTVSGLHVPWNLQVMVGAGPNGNCSKGNKF